MDWRGQRPATPWHTDVMAALFLIVGGPAVGKSSTATALARRFPRAVHVEVDKLREMVVSGLALPSLEWPAGLVE